MPLVDTNQNEGTPNRSLGALIGRQPSPVDLEHPWMGLESFREETQAYFFGRDAEIAEIHLRLRSHPLLVLYGRSGLGKTSILNAGLVPRLRAENKHQRPHVDRLDYKKGAPNPVRQLFSALFGSALTCFALTGRDRDRLIGTWITELNDSLAFLAGTGSPADVAIPDLIPNDPASRLWLRLHWRKEPPLITHLILDQFEEVFTLGSQRPGAENAVRDALTILLQGAIPKPISHLIAEHDKFLDLFDPDSVPVRVILALRDDYVYALNRWKRHLPALGQNTFELRALRGPAAYDAVVKPGELRCNYRDEVKEENRAETGLPPIITEETARRIVCFVAERKGDVPLEEIEAVPPILSLLCRELNLRRFPPEPGEALASQITFNERDTSVETIIAAFYERCLAGRPEAVRIFIEEELVSYSGARLAQDEQSILKVFNEGCNVPGSAEDRRAPGYGDETAARTCLRELVDQRLLTSRGDGENPSYELIHDLLANVVEKSRTAREERFEKELAEGRAAKAREDQQAAEKKARITRRRAALTTSLVTFAFVIAAIAAWVGFREAGEAKRERTRAEEAATNALYQTRLATQAQATAEIKEQTARTLFDDARLSLLLGQTNSLYPSGPEALPTMSNWLIGAKELLARMPEHRRREFQSRETNTSQQFERRYEKDILQRLLTNALSLQELSEKVTQRLTAVENFKKLALPRADAALRGTAVTPEGVDFRLWAPHADSVAVVLNVDSGKSVTNLLQREPSGHWAGRVATARAGQNYFFLLRSGTNVLRRIDPYASEVNLEKHYGVIHGGHTNADNFRIPSGNQLVIYEIHPGTFNATTNAVGGFESIGQKLSYLQDLGINAIQLMPIHEFPTDYSWGYNPSALFAVESGYGGPTAFKALVDAAHARGIAILLDVVYSHLGPFELDLWRFDGWSTEQNDGGIYIFDRGRSHTPWGDTRPDYSRPEVATYLRDNAIFWLTDMGVDGLRIDGTALIRNKDSNDDPETFLPTIPEGWNLLRWINGEAHKMTPRKLMIAEEWRNNDWVTTPLEAGGNGFDARWDPLFAEQVRQIAIVNDDGGRDLNKLAPSLLSLPQQAFKTIIYTESHDAVANGHARLPEEIAQSVLRAEHPNVGFTAIQTSAPDWTNRVDVTQKAKACSILAATLVLTLPGIPMIFQGQEMFERDYFRDTVPLDWSNQTNFADVVAAYRTLIHLRRDFQGKTAGLQGDSIQLLTIDNIDKVLAFMRWDPGRAGSYVVVLFNFKGLSERFPTNPYPPKYSLAFPFPGKWVVRFDWSTASTSKIDSQIIARDSPLHGMPASAEIDLSPFEAIILSQD